MRISTVEPNARLLSTSNTARNAAATTFLVFLLGALAAAGI
jgi:hypothetical protein